MRLFLAVDLDRAARAVLAGVLASAERATGSAGESLRWTAAENVHITLHFIGELDPERARRATEMLRAPVALAPFDASLDRFGVFPPTGPPRTVWLGVGSGASSLRQMHAELGRRLVAPGFDVEPRPFAPHATVARVRPGTRDRARAAILRLADLQLPPLRWTVRGATLFKSDLSGPRPKYTSLGTVELAAAGGAEPRT